MASNDLFALIYSSCRLYFAERIEFDHFPIESHVRFAQVNGPVMNTNEQTNFIEKFQWQSERAQLYHDMMNSEETLSILEEAINLIDQDINVALS